MDELEVTGGFVGGLRLVSDPVVDRADALDEQSETAELPSHAEIRASLPQFVFDPLVASPASGLRGWSSRLRAVLRGCGRPLILVTALCAGPLHLFAGRVVDTIVAAPALSDLAGGVGLLLLPLMWLSYLALTALPMALCLAGVVTVALAWAAGGPLPSVRDAVGSTLHRVGPLWAWLGAVGALVQIRWLLIVEPDDARAGLVLSLGTALLSAMLAVLMGVLGCVVLFERGRGLRRAFWLLSVGPRAAVAGLGVAGVASAVLPSLAEAAAGPFASATIAVACALLWAVASLITYAQARRVRGPLTSAQLYRELSA